MWFDFPVLDFIQENIRNGFLDPIMAGLSFFANKGIAWYILALILLIPKKTRPAAATAIAAITLGFLVGELGIKHIVCRVRPYDAYEAYHGFAMPFTLNAGMENSFSFPSGHTSCSFAAAISAYKINKTTGIITTVVAVLIGFSRLYNYVHFPTDVLAGMVVGILSAVTIILIFRKFNVDDKLTGIGQKRKTF